MTFSLVVKVKFKDAEELENLPINVFLDDIPNEIKKKVSLIKSASKLLYIPFIKLELKIKSDETEYIEKLATDSPVTILDKNYPHLDPFSTILSIEVTTLIDDLLQQNYEEIHMETEKRNMIFFDKFKSDYPDLREDTFLMALRIVLFKSNPVIHESLKGSIGSSMEYLLVEMNKEAADLSKTYSKLTDYLKSASQINYTNPRPEEFVITNINYTGILGHPVDIVDIFNNFKLSDDIPFIGIGGQFIERQNPIVRVYKLNGQRVIPDKEIKDFYVTENKKQNTVVYKKVKGIVFKIRIPETSTYLTLLIEPSGVFWISIKPNKTQSVIDVVLENKVKPLLNLLDGGSVKFILSNISANIETPFYINLETFTNSIKRPSITKFLFKLKPTISTELMSILYKDDITINLKDNPYLINSSVLSILGTSGFWQLCVIYTQIMIVDNLTLSDVGSQVESQQIKERSNIKRLKELGVKVKSTNCQKQRQPVIVDTNKITQLPIPNSYTLDYMGKTYMCTNEEHPFPGFTNENILCCFKKDQRQKEAFIRNTKPQVLVSAEASSQKQRKQHVITTEKLLQNNRFGVLPNGLRESVNDILEIKNIFRYGVIQDQLAFFNALAKVDPKFNDNASFFWQEFQTFLKSNENTIKKLYMKNLDKYITSDPGMIPIETYNTPQLDNFLLVISFFTRRNYFIFEEERLECTGQIISDFSFPFVILIKRNGVPPFHWELVVERQKDEQPKIIFKRDHQLIKFMERYYNFSCEKEDYYPESFSSKYAPLPQLSNILGNITGIQYQVVNLENNKVNYVWVTNSGISGLIPVKESTPKFGIAWKWISEVKFSSLENQVFILEKFKQDPLGLAMNKDVIVGIVANTGVICPIIPLQRNEYTGSLKEIDSILGSYIIIDSINWNRKKDESTYQNLRIEIARYLNRVNPDLRDTIISLVTNPKLEIFDKRKKLMELIPEQFKEIYSSSDISELINELCVENISSDIVNNTVSSKFIDLLSTLQEDVLYESL